MSALDLTLMVLAVVFVFAAFVALPHVVRRVRGEARATGLAHTGSFATAMIEHRSWMADAVVAHVARRPLPPLVPATPEGDVRSETLGTLLFDARSDPARARSVARLLRRPRALRDVVLALGLGSFVTGLTTQPWLLVATLGAMLLIWSWHRVAAAAQAVAVHLQIGDRGVRVVTDSEDIALRWTEVAWLTRAVTELAVGRRRLGRRFEIELGRHDGGPPVLWRCEAAGDRAPPVLGAALAASRAWVRAHLLAAPYDGELCIPTRGGGAVVWSTDRVIWRGPGAPAPVEVALDGAEVYVARQRRDARLVVHGRDEQQHFECPWRDISAPTCFEEAWRHFVAPWRASGSASSVDD